MSHIQTFTPKCLAYLQSIHFKREWGAGGVGGHERSQPHGLLTIHHSHSTETCKNMAL